MGRPELDTPHDTAWAWRLGVLLALFCGCRGKEVVAAFPDAFVGVGVELTLRDDEPVVVRVLDSGSAAEAGVKVGDRLVAINGAPTRAKSLGDVVMSIRGRPGTQVTMTLMRSNDKHIVVVQRRAMKKGEAGYRASPDG